MSDFAPAPPPTQAPGDHPGGPPVDRRFGLTTSPALYRWLLLGRALLAVSTAVVALLSFRASPEIALAALILAAIELAVAAWGSHLALVRGERVSLRLLQAQAVVDLLLVTALVHFAGGQESGWAALYVLFVAIYALLMPVRSGLVLALFGAGLFLADAYFMQEAASQAGVWGQVAVFTIVFAVVAVLGQRLRVAALEQLQLETALAQARLEADEILRNIRSGVLTVDGRGQLAFINPNAEQLLGLAAEDRIGRPVLEELERIAPELYEALADGIRTGQRVARAEGSVRRAGDRPFPIGLSTTTFHREGERIPTVTAIFTDISELQYLQELHVRAERLEAVAALGASLAHEIRNPLASVRSAVEQLARSRRDDPDERVLGDLILRETDRVSRLLSEFLDFSRVRATQFTTVNLLALVQDVARLVKEHPECGKGVDVRVTGDPLLIRGDEDLLHRIVWNLSLNAVQAVKNAGRIDIELDRPSASALPGGSEFDQPVRLKISDNGPGIDPDVREQLFQPFVTGRPGGSGLGLAIVQRAVEAHRGLVLVDSAPGGGTTFTILLHAKGPTEETA